MQAMDAIVETLHVHSDDLPWVSLQEGMELRLLHVSVEDNFVVQHVRAQPGVRTELHRHSDPVFGFTLKGAWGHDESYSYVPGTYIYEMPGVVHRFLNGPEVSEAVFVVHGTIDILDAQGEVTRSSIPASALLDAYLDLCAKEGHPAPRLLR